MHHFSGELGTDGSQIFGNIFCRKTITLREGGNPPNLEAKGIRPIFPK